MSVERLDKLQASKNDGRGISCVKTLIFYLRKDDVRSAQAVYFNESDKIRNYPDVDALIQQIFEKVSSR